MQPLEALETYMKKTFSILKHTACLLCCLGIFLGTSLLWASNFPLKFTQLSLEQGLSQANAYALLQDREGFIWIGTEDGLHRFDGYAFEYFTYQPDDPASLSYNDVRALAEDPEGYLWVGTHGGGINRLSPDRSRVERMGQPATRNLSIQHIQISQKGEVYFATEEGEIWKWKEEEDAFRSLPLPAAEPLSILGFWENARGELFLATPRQGAFVWQEGDSPSWKPVYEKYFERGLTAICRGDSQAMWLMGKDGIWRLSQEGEIEKKHDFAGQAFAADVTYQVLAEDPQKRLWLGSQDQGLACLLSSSRQWVAPLGSASGRYALRSNRILSLLSDRQGGMWVGTFGGGVHYYHPIYETFPHFRAAPDRENTLSHPVVRSFYQDQEGGLWVATYGGGLSHYSPSRDRVKHFRHDPQRKGSLLSDDVLYVYRDKANHLWVGTQYGLDLMEDEARGQFRHFFPNSQNPQALQHGEVRFLFEDSRGRFWVGTAGGLHLMDRKQGRFQAILPDPTDSLSISHEDIRAIYETKDSTLWIATYGGLNRLEGWEGGKPRFATFFHDLNNPNSLSIDWVQCLQEGEHGDLWIGTSAGLNHLEAASETITRFSEADGLPSHLIYGILPGKAGEFWLSTNRGLVRFKPRQGQEKPKFRSFGLAHGLQSLEFNGQAYHQGPQGELFFGGINGFNAFFPANIQADTIPPTLVIRSFLIQSEEGQEIEPDTIPQALARGRLSLPWDQRNFTLVLAGLHFAQPEANAYALRLDWFDKSWRYLGPRRYASYTNLRPGTYQLWGKAANPDGTWGEARQLLEVTIRPPFWLSKPALLMYLFLLALLVLGALAWWRQRLRRIRRQLAREQEFNEKLQDADRLKDEFLLNTAHQLSEPIEHMISLASSLGRGIAGEPSPPMRQNLSLIVNTGKRLINQVKGIQDFSRLKSKNLTLDYLAVDMFTLTDVVVTIHTPLARAKKIDLVNEVAQDLPLAWGDENRIMQVLHNLVENALKHTSSGEVRVGSEVVGENVLISVRDTGEGLSLKQQRRIFESMNHLDQNLGDADGELGLGLTLAKQLVELHGGSFWFESEKKEGSCFFFTIPLAKGEQIQGVEKAAPSLIEEEPPAGIQLSETLAKVSGERGMARVLIVDDDPVSQQVISNYLLEENMEVIGEHNGQDALDRIEAGEHFDLILLDLVTPRVSGFELCQRIREKYLPSELPVIFITTQSRVEEQVRGFEYGANDCLTKPFSKEEFLARIKTHLNMVRINTAYNRFVPREFIRSLGHESILDIKLGDQVEKEVTVLFADIRDYTGLAETMTPQDNFNFLNSYLGRLGPIIKAHNGIVNQYFGDGVMALFLGKPTDAIQAAIAMQQDLTAYNKSRQNKNRLPIRTGIGLHTGPLILGILGDEERMEAGVVSDTVNTASRMEGLTKVFGANIIASEPTLAGLDDPEAMPYRFLGKIKVKGKKEPKIVYEFFEGDKEEVRKLKIEAMPDYEIAMNAYFNKNFALASEYFRKVLILNPNDMVAKRYLLHCTKYMIQGVSERWDGVEEMVRK
jgi:two-component system sensor histidine kinase ChiS